MKIAWILEKYGKRNEENTLTPEQMENIAVCDELLETYLETGIVEERTLHELIIQRENLSRVILAPHSKRRCKGFLEWRAEIYGRT